MIVDINTPQQMALYASKMPNALMCTDKKKMFLYEVEGKTKKCIAVCSCDDFNSYMEGEGKTKFKVTLKMSRHAKTWCMFGTTMFVVLVVAIGVIATGGLALFAGMGGLLAAKAMCGCFGCCITGAYGVANAENEEVHVRRL
jgi:hypothetical protein